MLPRKPPVKRLSRQRQDKEGTAWIQLTALRLSHWPSRAPQHPPAAVQSGFLADDANPALEPPVVIHPQVMPV